MPEGQTDDKLAEEFATFFLGKIQNIHNKFTGIEELNSSINEQELILSKFLQLSYNKIHKELLSMNNKTCKLDHIPTEIIKRIPPAILGTITEIVNLSLSTGSFTLDWKTVIAKPLLKKPGLDIIKKNYRPVSILSFWSKLVE